MSYRLKDFRYMLEYAFVLPLYLLIRLMPRRLLFSIAWLIGFAMFCIPSFRKLLMANIATAFPEAEKAWVRRTARRSIVNLIFSLMDFFWFTGRPAMLDKYTRYAPYIHRAVRGGEGTAGVICVASHLGNWELAGYVIKHHSDLPVAVVARMTNNPYLNHMINGGRGSAGNVVIKAKGAVKSTIKALRDGCFVATLIDQNTRVRDGGIFVDFFDLPVPTSAAPAFFAEKLGTHVFIGGLIRKGFHYFSFCRTLSKPFEEYADDKELLQELMSLTERLVRKYPDQYLWFYKRFQYIPRDAGEDLIKRYPYYSHVADDRFYFKRKR